MLGKFKRVLKRVVQGFLVACGVVVCLVIGSMGAFLLALGSIKENVEYKKKQGKKQR